MSPDKNFAITLLFTFLINHPTCTYHKVFKQTLEEYVADNNLGKKIDTTR